MTSENAIPGVGPQGSLAAAFHRVAQAWPWAIAGGVLAIVAGFIALFYPGVTVLALAILLGAFLLVQGVVQLMDASRLPAGSGRGWLIAYGALGVVAGIICLFSPAAGVVALVVGLVLWFLVSGIDDLAQAAASIRHRGWNITLGVIGIVAAVVIVARPGVAVGTVALLAGLGLLLRGALLVGLGVQMRRVHQSLQPGDVSGQHG